MPTTLQLRRGSTTQHNTFVGAAGEITVDTDKNTIVVHDGATAGGFPVFHTGANATLNNLIVSGNLTVQGTTTTLNNANTQTVDLGDNDKIRLGDNNELQMYHTGIGGAAFVDNTEGVLTLRPNGQFTVSNYTTAETYITAAANSGVQLFYDGSTKLTTNNTGIDIAGTATTDGLTVDGTSYFSEIIENGTLNATTSGTIDIDLRDGALWYLNTAQTANRTINFRATSSETLDSILNNIDSITAAIILTNGATPYYFNTIQVDGSTITPKYQGGISITSGNANSLDVYSFTILKTGSGTFEVLMGMTQFA